MWPSRAVVVRPPKTAAARSVADSGVSVGPTWVMSNSPTPDRSATAPASSGVR